MDEYLKGLGGDPGFARTGYGAVALHQPTGEYMSLGVELVKTEPNKEKRFEHLRVSADDSRRLKIYYDATCAAIEKIGPHVLGVECYTIFESREYERLRDAATTLIKYAGIPKGRLDDATQLLERLGSQSVVPAIVALAKAVDDFRIQRGRGAAAKTYGVYTAFCCAAYRYNLPVYIFMPMDLKMAACNKKSASKEEVADALALKIKGLREKVESKIRAKSMHEHVYDASGHGMLALHNYSKWLRDGVSPTASQTNMFQESE